VLIIEQVNRLSRLPWMEHVELWKEILRRGIVIRTCAPPARYTAENMNDLSVGCPVVILMMLAHQESVQKSEWVRSAWAAKKKRAAEERTPHGQNCPKWLRPVTAPHPKDPARRVTVAYAEVPERAAVVRRIFALARGGMGAYRIRALLEAEGVPAFGRSKRWTLVYVKQILTRREAAGDFQPTARDALGRWRPSGPPVKGYYPIVIGEEEFAAARDASRARRNKGGRGGTSEASLFTHIARQATTGRPLQCRCSVAGGKHYRYLDTDCAALGIPYQAFEDAVLEGVGQLTGRDVDGRHQTDELAARVETLQAQRARLGLELDSLDGQIRELPPAQWPRRVVARMAELEAAVKEKDAELRAAKEAANTSGRTEALTDLQVCVDALAALRGTPEAAAARRRVKARLPLILESIWVHVEGQTRRSRFVHVELRLAGGQRRYFVLTFGRPAGGPSDLSGCDFAAGEVGRHARRARRPKAVG
jgi:DNA invertase Pin-like site-specific DNA recombinase